MSSRASTRLVTVLGMLILVASGFPARSEEPPWPADAIRLGGVFVLEGDSKDIGHSMMHGVRAALEGQQFRGRPLAYRVRNDFYNPATTEVVVKELIEEGVVAMLGNTGTPTARVSVPLLQEAGVAAVGFYTGGGLLRPGPGNVINYRASYAQEVQSVVKDALAAGVPPASICAYAQNDAFGMAGVEGLYQALEGQPGIETELGILEKILALDSVEPPRNHLGPVGVYSRNTLGVREGYDSLKGWEAIAGQPCQLVVTVGTYTAIANFIGYARYKNEPWKFTAISGTGPDALRQALVEYDIHEGVVVTQIVPAMDSTLPIVQEARQALGEDLDYVSLEGYVVGRMFLALLENLPDGEISGERVLQAARGQVFNVGGLALDFRNDNQGSDLVVMTLLDGDDYRTIPDLREFLTP